MADRYSNYLNTIHLSGDVICFNMAFVLAYYLKFGLVSGVIEPPYLNLILIANLVWLGISWFFHPHKLHRTFKVTKTLSHYFLLIGLHLLCLTAYWALSQAYYYSREQFILTYLFFLVLMVAWKTIFLYLIRIYRQSGFNIRRVVIVGYGELGENLRAYFMQHPEIGYRFEGYFDKKDRGPRFLGTIEQLYAYAKANQVEEIYCCLPDIDYGQVKKIIDFGEENLLQVKLIADFRGFFSRKVELERYDHIPVINVTSKPLDSYFNRLLKRFFDIAFASVVILLFFSWLFPIIALAIRLSSPGPIFFKQKRSGLKNQTFWCYKFRTMKYVPDAGFKQATKNDPRITRVGAFLRKTSLDELPQFFNVLLGNMSVVGPRPHPLKLTEDYSKLVSKFMSRHFVKPGITGLAQCKGYRGETPRLSAMENRIRLDRFYVHKWSFLFDVKIVILTIIALLKGEDNAY